jgi:hypothetical protein
MKLFTWIKGLLQPQGDTIRVNSLTMPLAKWEAMRTPPQAAPAPAEMPSDELMEQWKRAAVVKYLNGGEPTWRTAALLAFAEGQQQAQSLQIPPPGAEPVATDGDLLKVLDPILWADDARRALYNLGRADERTAILRALGVEL